MARVVLISLDGFASFYWRDPRVHMPTLRRLAERGVVARRMDPMPEANPMIGELVLEAAEGYAFGDEARGEDHVGPPRYRGNHGHRPHHPDNGAFFLAAGASVRHGAELDAIKSRDVAPTVAHLLDVKLGDVEGTLVVDALA